MTSVTGVKYGTPEYGKAWRELHKVRLAEERKIKYHGYVKDRYLRRRYWLYKYKEARGCDDCGYNLHGVALDFDHLDRRHKKFNISSRLSLSTVKTLFAEIRKCQLLCANCHRIKTLEENQFVQLPESL